MTLRLCSCRKERLKYLRMPFAAGIARLTHTPINIRLVTLSFITNHKFPSFVVFLLGNVVIAELLLDPYFPSVLQGMFFIFPAELTRIALLKIYIQRLCFRFQLLYWHLLDHHIHGKYLFSSLLLLLLVRWLPQQHA